MKRQSIKANFIYNMMFQVLNILLPLITTPYISRILGAANIGIYSYTYSMISTFVMVGSLGIGTYGQREISASGDSKTRISTTFWEIQIVKTISVSIVCLGYTFFAIAYKEYSIYLLAQLPYFLAAILDISWLYQGLENFKYVAVRNIIVKILSLILIFSFVKSAEDLLWYLAILWGAQLVGNVIMWRQIPEVVGKPHVQFKHLGKHIRPVFVYFIPTISYQIYAVLDKAMLGFIGNDISENGYYEQAHKLVNMVTVVITSYTVVMRSRMTVYFSQNNIEKIKEHLSSSLHFIGLLIFPMTFGLAALASNIVPWFFGDGYSKIIILLVIFSPFFIVHSFGSYIGTHILTPSGQQGKSNIGQCAAAGMNVILNSLLIPSLGSTGAAIASVFAECIIVVFYMYFSKQYLSIKWVAGTVWKYFICAFGMFCVLKIIVPILPSTIIGSCVGVILGMMVYFIELLFVRDRYFTQIVVNTINSVKKKYKM